jgi:chemotaxis protein MotB
LRRRKQQGGHANHERWLVSYADFITLLFAFFVVMFATAQSDRSKAKEVSDSVRQALEHGQMSTALAGVLRHGQPGAGEAGRNSAAPVGRDSQPADTQPDLKQSQAALNQELEMEVKSGKLQIRLDARGLIVSLREAAFFASGDDAVSPSSYPILEKVAAVVKTVPNPVRLEGHTDSVPIHTPRFRSNWELSAARAIAMLELFSDRFGISPQRMAVAGYADTAPADGNDTGEGRAHNRRVDLVVLTKEAAAAREPGLVTPPR